MSLSRYLTLSGRLRLPWDLAQAHVPVSAAAPVGRQQAKDHLVGEFPAYPRRLAEPALGHEPGPLGGPDHRRVAGQGIDLQPVQAADAEAVLTQRQDYVCAQAAAPERGPQRQS